MFTKRVMATRGCGLSGSRIMVFNRHDRTKTFQPDAHEDNRQAHQLGSSGPGARATAQFPVDSPHLLAQDPGEVLHIHASRFPNGITITDFGFDISAASAGYTVALKKYTSPTDGAPVTIESVATVGAAQEAEDDGTIDNPDVDAGDLIYLDFPTTTMAKCHVWITFTID